MTSRRSFISKGRWITEKSKMFVCPDYNGLFRPRTVWQAGHVCIASWQPGTQRGIKQQPKAPPKMKIKNIIRNVIPPISYWTFVITCCRHVMHCVVEGLCPRNPPIGWTTTGGGGYIPGAGPDCAPTNEKAKVGCIDSSSRTHRRAMLGRQAERILEADISRRNVMDH